MFTGIPTEIGVITKVESKQKVWMEIACKNVLPELKPGMSINIDGACLTVMEITNSSFTISLIPETHKRTAFAGKKAGDKLHLELPMRLGDRLTGGIVSGLVDAVVKVKKVESGEGKYEIVFELPVELKKYISPRVGVVINGIGLNTSIVTKDSFTIPLYPYVLQNTNLLTLKKGNVANLEVSSMARMVVHYLECKE